MILDYFGGSGTTAHAVINLNRQDGGRRQFILVEMGKHLDTVLLPRLKKVTFTPSWADGKPTALASPNEAKTSPGIIKIIRLESYEDALNNLVPGRTAKQDDLLASTEAQGAGSPQGALHAPLHAGCGDARQPVASERQGVLPTRPPTSSR